MAIKIDLLPGYVKLEKWRNVTIFASLAVVALVVSGLVVALDAKNKDLAVINDNLAAAQVVADKTTAAENAASTAAAASAPIEGTCTWILSASKTGPERAALINLVTQYIYDDAVVQSIDLSDGKTVKIQASVKDPAAYRRFMMTLRRGSDVAPNNGSLFAGTPSTGGVGSFPQALDYRPPVLAPGDAPAVLYYPITVSAGGNLKYPVAVPQDPTTGAAAPAGGIPGEPGFAPPPGAP